MNIGDIVSAYYDSHRKVLSLKCVDGYVRLKPTSVCLEQVQFVVRPSGRRLARETSRKTPHAFIRGTLREFNGNAPPLRWVRNALPFRYRPQFDDGFTSLHGGEILVAAKEVYLAVVDGHPVCYAAEPRFAESATVLDCVLSRN